MYKKKTSCVGQRVVLSYIFKLFYRLKSTFNLLSISHNLNGLQCVFLQQKDMVLYNYVLYYLSGEQIKYKIYKYRNTCVTNFRNTIIAITSKLSYMPKMRKS